MILTGLKQYKAGETQNEPSSNLQSYETEVSVVIVFHQHIDCCVYMDDIHVHVHVISCATSCTIGIFCM